MVYIRRMPVTYKKAWLSQQLEASASRNNCRRQRRQPSRSKSAPKPWGLDIRSKPRRSPIRDNAFFPRRLPPRVNFASIVLEARAAPEGKKVAARSPPHSRIVNSFRNWELCNDDIWRTRGTTIQMRFEQNGCLFIGVSK